MQLVDYIGKAIKSGNRSVIHESLKPILTRLSINTAHWVSTVSTYKYAFDKAVCSLTQLDDGRKVQNQKDGTNTQWLKGNKVARNFYNKNIYLFTKIQISLFNLWLIQ